MSFLTPSFRSILLPTRDISRQRGSTRRNPIVFIHKDPLINIRWPFRRPVAISWLILQKDDGGILSPVRLKTVGLPEYSEQQMLSEFFMDIASLEQFMMVSWGGCFADIPRLLLAAMNQGMTLPASLHSFARPFDRKRPHFDLMKAVSGGTDNVHLTEVAAAMEIPAKTLGVPTAVAGFIAAGKWSSVKAVCEGDVIATAFILLRYLSLTSGASKFSTADRLASFAARQTHRPYAEVYAAHRDQLREQADADARALRTLLAA
jgi:predicted PolB exonuclease-like 3'-5' exonuclease